MSAIPVSLSALIFFVLNLFSGTQKDSRLLSTQSFLVAFPSPISQPAVDAVYNKRFKNIGITSYQLQWITATQLRVALSSSLSSRALKQILIQPGALSFHSLESNANFLEKAHASLSAEEKIQTQWLEPLSTLSVKNEKILQKLTPQLPPGKFAIEKNQDLQAVWTIYLLEPAALTNEHIASFQNVVTENGFNLEHTIQFTPQGTSLLANFTTTHRHQTICVVFDGTALVCPRVMEPILQGKLLMTARNHTIEDLSTSYYEAFPAFAGVEPLPVKPEIINP